MNKFNVVTTTLAVLLFPIWVIGFLFGLLFRPFIFGFNVGFYLMELWQYKITQKEQDATVRDAATDQLQQNEPNPS